ncbi:MAG: HupE/UreJ family protein [Alphaproteobacteria bacterium]|nr:HupE/UreJ family protein [Alphaproteobacteria bacterium]
MTRLFFIVIVVLQFFSAARAGADELRPAYLALREVATDEFSVHWKVPAAGNLRLGLSVALPEACASKSEPVRGMAGGAFFERWSVVCPGGLKGKAIRIDGLRTSFTDVLARVEYRGGSTQVVRLGAASPSFVVTGAQTGLDVATTYMQLGIEHILTSLDHLLFVLALILLIDNSWVLVKTITAFTVAHSITLAGAALGYLSLPQKPVEATIALSIAFLAVELVKMGDGPKRLSQTYPWIVAFAFGLLHGFGFAGALKEIGLPQADVPLALLTFNLGVEVGQFIFVVGVVMGGQAAAQLFTIALRPTRLATAYLIGTISLVWLISRVSAF